MCTNQHEDVDTFDPFTVPTIRFEKSRSISVGESVSSNLDSSMVIYQIHAIICSGTPPYVHSFITATFFLVQTAKAH